MYVPRALPSPLTVTLLLAGAAMPFAAPVSDVAVDDVRSYVKTSFNMTEADLARVDRTHVVTRTLPANDPREIGTLGVVRLPIQPAAYVERIADITRFKKDEAVLQIGVFGSTPTLQDIASLTLDDADIRNLRDCQVGHCGLRLSADAIARYQAIDWRRPDASQRANALMRQMLVDHVAEYRRRGDTASMQYADKPEPLNLGREFAALSVSGPGGCEQFPDLRRHLLEYPADRTPETVDVIYWSKERVGRRTVVSVTHLVTARITGETPVDYVIASKQIYASHYFDASLGLTVLLRDRSGPPELTYLVYVNRSRVDIFGGVFGGVARAIVSSRARSVVSDVLVKLQHTFEGNATAAPPG